MYMRTNRRVWAASAIAAVAALAIGACGGGSSSSTATTTSPTSPSTTPAGAVTTTTITIASNNTVTPKNIIVSRGSIVTFINNDNVPHQMFSNPHPEHTDCPEINQVGFLSPGQTLGTGNMVSARAVCGFHDHGLPDVAGLQGSISIQ